MARMAWFKKERKPRTSERVKLEIPADAWEKCDECGHIDIKDRLVRALNVCPNCGHHRRISAQEYIDLLVDEGSWHELDARLRSTDPLHFENYPQRLETAIQKAGPLEAVRTGYGRLDGMPLDVAVMDFNFMARSWSCRRRAGRGCRRECCPSCRWPRPRSRSPACGRRGCRSSRFSRTPRRGACPPPTRCRGT